MFLWIGITAWYWKVNLYAFTNCAYTITWIYYAAGTITSIRGIVGECLNIIPTCTDNNYCTVAYTGECYMMDGGGNRNPIKGKDVLWSRSRRAS